MFSKHFSVWRTNGIAPLHELIRCLFSGVRTLTDKRIEKLNPVCVV
jgi:hypothetical protein